MLAIKLQRIGKKHQPSYRVVVAEKRSKLAGPPVEDLGSFNTFTKAVALKRDRVTHWIQAGAKPTATVWNLLVKHGVLPGPKVKIPMRRKSKGEKGEPAVTPAEAAPSETPAENA